MLMVRKTMIGCCCNVDTPLQRSPVQQHVVMLSTVLQPFEPLGHPPAGDIVRATIPGLVIVVFVF